MRVPLTWLREYVSVPETASGLEVAADLVRVGLEEEAVHGGGVQGPLVVGRVLEFVEEPQKNGKTIRWCQVDVGAHNGDAPSRGIVCGAGNFIVGDLIVASLPGAVLPGGFAIAARKTYGHVSDGMICSARELGLGDDHDGIIRLGEWGLDAAPGDDAIALLGLGEETVEVNVTPDRGYAFSIRGVAREYAHATGATFTDPAARDELPTSDQGFAIRLDDQAPIRGVQGCDRYTGLIVRGVKASAPSPQWMQRRLEQAGMRPISLAVDVTNYVMLALGQPLHAFDLDKLQAPIVVRRAQAGERLTTLDDVERKLDPEDLLITDSDGARVLALAGVMGGASSEVTDTTTDILLEAAHFDAVTVARTARRHKLSTEASRRFERGVDHDLARRASGLAAELLIEFGGGTIGDLSEVDQRQPRPAIAFDLNAPSAYVGCEYTREEVLQTLTEIGCTVSAADGSASLAEAGTTAVSVVVPSWRPDLTGSVELIEEVARLRGYDRIPSVLPIAPPGRGLSAGQRARRSIARALAEHGGVEVLSYPFMSPETLDDLNLAPDDPQRSALRLANPLSDEQPLMRTSVLATLLPTLRRNVGRGSTDLALFEIGLVTRPGSAALQAPQLPGAVKPSQEDLDRLLAAVPAQPRMAAVALCGFREAPGWDTPGRPVAWSDAVALARLIGTTVAVDLDVTAADQAPWHPGRCAQLSVGGAVVGYAGELHPKVVAALGLPERTCAAEVNLEVLLAAMPAVVHATPVATFPVAKEDVALIVADDLPAAAVREALAQGGGELLESVRLFDVYAGPQVGEGKASLAFSLRFRAPDRTLTAAEVAAARGAAVAVAQERCGAVLRGA